MELTYPQIDAGSEPKPVTGNSATPFSQQTVVLTKQAYIQLKWDASYWQRQHARQMEREAALKAQVAALEATVRDLTPALVWHQERESRRSRESG